MRKYLSRADNWRPMSVEIGIVVVGVLIALGAEQVAQSLNQQRQVAEAKADFQSELSSALLAAKERIKMESCVDRQLARFDELARLPGTVAIEGQLQGGIRSWSSTIWQSAVSSGAASHMSADERAAYSQAYAIVDDLHDWNMKEFELTSELSTLRQPAVMTEVARDRLRSSIAKLRDLNAIMALASEQLIDQNLMPMGVRMRPENAKLLKEVLNTCPMPRRLN
jgi:hypothetical protein